ncbi:hypothetical protein NKJ46_22500 [Mesorhizobium sp. M0166]|uniref:hypothetical protein n=1 Tax=Mesorhizobium sp. M0166 TaxID=2956902 RepID=UPI003337C4C8
MMGRYKLNLSKLVLSAIVQLLGVTRIEYKTGCRIAYHIQRDIARGYSLRTWEIVSVQPQ